MTYNNEHLFNLFPVEAAPNTEQTKQHKAEHPEYKTIPETKPKNSWEVKPHTSSEEAFRKSLPPSNPTTTNATSSSFWDIKPLESFDELPDDAVLQEQATENTLATLLAPSNRIIEELYSYLKSNNINARPANEFANKENIQTFTIDNKTFLLNDEEHLKNIYVKILNLGSPETLTHTLNRRPNLIKHLTELVTIDESITKHPILGALPPEFVIKQLTRGLSFMMNHALQDKKKPELSFRTATVSQNLGNMFLETFITKHYQYINTDFYEHNAENGFSRSELDSGPNKDKVYEFVRRNSKHLQLIIDTLMSNKEVYLPANDTTDFIMTNSATVDFMDPKDKLNYFTDTKLDPKLRTVILYSLSKYCESVDSSILLPTDKELAEYAIDYTKYGFELGEIITAWLKKIGFFTEIVESNKKGGPGYKLTLNQSYAVDLFVAGSLYKAPISKVKFPTVYTVKHGDKLTLNIDLKQETIRDSSSSVKLEATDTLHNILESYKNTPFRIAEDQFNDFISLLEKMLLSTEISATDELTQIFMNTLYDIDFALLYENNTNKKLVNKLAKFGIDFITHFDPELQAECKDNLACVNAYNVISAYKFYIKGFLNEVNIYKHVNHFYIPHFVASTGRVFSFPYYLQLQGNKFAFPFITYVRHLTKLTNEELAKTEELIQETFPEIPKSTFLLNSLQADNLAEAFYEDSRGLFNQYVFSFLHESGKNNIQNYPFASDDIVEQLRWLSKHCKKQFELLYVRHLIHAALNNDFQHLIIRQDATGSGSQIIAMLMRDLDLARRTNVLHSATAHDLYKEILNSFVSRMEIQKNTVESFCKEVLELTPEEFFAETNNTNTFGGQLKELLLKRTQTELQELYRKMISPKKDPRLDVLYNKIITFKFPVTNLAVRADLTRKVDPLFKALSKANEYFKHYLIYQKIPADLLTRKTFKVATMALGYGQGDSSRFDSFNNSITEYYIKQGYAELPLSKDEIMDICILLNDAFTSISNELLKPVDEFLKITTRFTKTQSIIKIPMKYLTWKFRPICNLSFRHYVKVGGKERRYTLYHSYGLDEKQMQITFPSIFVQGIDAHIVHNIIDRTTLLNQKLREHNLPELFTEFNHDCFGFRATYTRYQKRIVQQAYNSINELSFPMLPTLLSKLAHPIKCTSMYCIKY